MRTRCASLRRSLHGIDPLLRQELEAGAFDGLLHEEHCDEEPKELSTQACESAESENLNQGDVGYLRKRSRLVTSCSSKGLTIC